MNQGLGAAPVSAERIPFGDIHRANLVRFADEARGGLRSGAKAKDVPADIRKQIGCGFAEETAAGNYDPRQAPTAG
jgi:hypothetical protein